ncbi:MAG: cation transporter [Nitrospiraceae bacterium]
MKEFSLLISLSVVGVLLGAGGLAFATTQQEVPPVTAAEEVITLKIDGWTCASCEKGIRRALEAVPGVRRAEVSYARGGAAVEVEPGRVTGEQLVQAVAHAGNILSSYRATVVPNGTLTAGKRNDSDILNWFRKLLH